MRQHATYAYDDFVRGRYGSEDTATTDRLFSEMTAAERETASVLAWDDDAYGLIAQLTGEEEFVPTWEIRERRLGPAAREQPEWGFPKGRRSYPAEPGRSCALREMQEETGVSGSDVRTVPCRPLVEEYTGTDGVAYRHVYHLALLRDDRHDIELTGDEEIGAVEWVPLGQAMERLESPERREVLRTAVERLRRTSESFH